MLVVFRGVFGIVVHVAFSPLFRKQHTQSQCRMLLISLAFQIGIVTLFLKYPFFKDLFGLLNGVVTVVDTATRAGTSMVFGFLGGSPEPFAFAVPQPANSFVRAFRALSIVLMFSVLWALLWHWGIPKWIITAIARVLEKSFRLGARWVSAVPPVSLSGRWNRPCSVPLSAQHWIEGEGLGEEQGPLPIASSPKHDQYQSHCTLILDGKAPPRPCRTPGRLEVPGRRTSGEA